MFHISTVSNSEISSLRLDAEFYHPEYIDNEVKLERFLLEKLDDLRCKQNPIVYGILKPEGKSQKYKVIKAENFDNMFVDPENCQFISSETYHNFKRSFVQAGDILIAIGGYVGRPAIVLKHNNILCNINRHVARLRINSNLVNSYYVTAYLSCSIGQKALTRQITGSVQSGINLEDLRKVPIPILKHTAQKYIGDKVRQAEQLRISTKQTKEMIHLSLKNFFAGIPKPTKNISLKISKNNLSSNRLEAEYYSSISLWAENEIKHGPFPYKPLKDIVLRIKDGPGGWGVSTEDYTENGIPVIRTVNIIDGECDLSNCIFISEKKHHELSTHKAKKGSVVLSVRGTIGRAAVFKDETYREASLNAAVVTIDCSDQIIPGYLVEFFNSEVGSTQSNRIANGAVQKNMNLEETGSNLITVPPLAIQIKIARLHELRINQKRYASRLILSAKLIVEGLIEGQITEQQIIDAQNALEAGDNSLDRDILSKITNKGIDKDGKPLFHDIDKLYDLLQESQEAYERKDNE